MIYIACIILGSLRTIAFSSNVLGYSLSKLGLAFETWFWCALIIYVLIENLLDWRNPVNLFVLNKFFLFMGGWFKAFDKDLLNIEIFIGET